MRREEEEEVTEEGDKLNVGEGRMRSHLSDVFLLLCCSLMLFEHCTVELFMLQYFHDKKTSLESFKEKHFIIFQQVWSTQSQYNKPTEKIRTCSDSQTDSNVVYSIIHFYFQPPHVSCLCFYLEGAGVGVDDVP